MADKCRTARTHVTMLASAIALSLTARVSSRPVANASAGASALRASIVLNDDGGWCWFQDERALVVGGRLVFGSVAAGRSDPSRRGMVEATTVDLATGASTRFRLSATPVEKAGRYDDHDTPALVERGDGRLVAVWAGHGYDNRILSRVSLRAGDATAWSEERVFVPSASSSVTYSNLHRLTGERGRIYDFFRGLDNRFKPSVAWSDDEGESWRAGGVVIDVPAAFRHRPYVKYASDGRETVHLAYTDGHPRNYDNSLYHAFYRAGTLHRSDGSAVRPLADGLHDPVEGTRIFQGDPANVAWVTDLELDAQGRPFVAYSVQKDSAGLPPGQGGADHRYRLAVWSGTRWDDREIAFAGNRLYAGEDDYTGGIALVPGDPTRLFISTDADPSTGAPLVSAADGKRHWEIFRGATADGGRTWRWQPLTRNSTADHLRPIVPRTAGRDELLLWLRGRYRSYTDYDLEVVGLLPAAGTLVDVGGHKLHIRCAGPAAGGPTVILEAGGGANSSVWSSVQELLSARVRTCAYDRAGSGGSEPGPAPRTMRQEAFELHALLDAAKVPGPFVLVGHSMGGLLVRLYAERYGKDVIGVVLLDPTHEDGRFGQMRPGESRPRLVRLREQATGRVIPDPRREGAPAGTQYKPEDDYLAEEFQQIYLSRKANPQPLGDRPLIVLVAAKPEPPPPGTSEETWNELQQEKSEQKADLARLSRNSKLVRDPASGHHIHRDDPPLVARAIEEVVEAASKGSRLAR